MKKFTLLLAFFAIFAWQSNAQTCTQTFTASGNDNTPTVLTINAVDVDCYGTSAVASMQLVNAAGSLTSGYCSTGGSSWYGFNLSIDGGASVPVCADEINLTDISGFTTLTITSQDNDDYTDGITITIDVEVTFTPTEAPECTTLISPANGDVFAPTTGDLTWASAVGGTDGYYLTVGTTTGGDDILATTDVGNVTTYNVGELAQSTTYFVSILPFNSIGEATGCMEESFTTYTPPTNDDCEGAFAITLGETLVASNLGASTTEGVDTPTCGTYNFGGDVWFTTEVPASGSISIETSGVVGSFTDSVLEVFTGECGTLTQIACNDDGGPGAFSLVELDGLLPGTVLYARSWEYGNNAFGDFNITAFDPSVDSETFCADGQDADAFVMTIDLSTFDPAAGDTFTLENFITHYSSPDGSTTYCGTWYDFTLNLDGTDILTGCADDINGTDLTGYTTATLTANDIDDYDDHVYICVDVIVATPPTCPAPTELAAETTDTTATLTWTAGGTETAWNLTYAEEGFLPGEETLVEGVTSPYEFTDLPPETAYVFFVQAVCGADDMSSWAGPFAYATSATPPEVGCGSYNMSNGFENGFGCISSSTFHVANDMVVNANTNSTLEQVVANFITNGEISNIEVMYHNSNADGLPNELLGSEDVVPTSQEVIGEAFGLDVRKVVLDITPFVFIVEGDAPETFWIELYVTMASGDAVYWEVSTATTSASPTANLNTATDDAAWAFSVGGEDGVFEFHATCANNIGVADATIDGFSMYPNPVEDTLTINATNNIDAIAVYNLLGQEVLNSTPSAAQVQLDTADLPTGAYIVKVQAGDQVASYNLIKQ